MTDMTAPHKQRVLVIDDEPAVIREVYQALAHDYQVLQATRADRGLTLVETMQPDLVLVDITLNDADGYALAHAIRQSFPVPVAFLAVPSDDRARGLELGALGFLSKPLDRDRILPAVKAWLKRRTDAPPPATANTVRPDAISRIAAVREIDSNAGLKNVAGSADLYLSVLRSLCDNHATIAADLVAAVAENDRATAILLAHTSKTILRTIGAAELGEIAFRIERSLKSGDSETHELPDLRARFDRMLRDIHLALFVAPPRETAVSP